MHVALCVACERRREASDPRQQDPGEGPRNKYAGGHRIRVTPVPIPNTEVKPDTADGTAWETVWESRSLPAVIHDSRRPDAKTRRAFCFVRLRPVPRAAIDDEVPARRPPHAKWNRRTLHRPVERAFQIDLRQAERPVARVEAVWLSCLSARPEFSAPAEGSELNPGAPQPVRIFFAARLSFE